MLVSKVTFFHTNVCNFVKIHSLMPGVSNLANVLLSTRSFHFCYSFGSGVQYIKY